MSTSFASAPALQGASTCKNTWVLADFDGDRQPELATGTSDGHNYNIEIQFSARNERTSITLTNAEFGVGLFAYDVDRDDDEDLVITSPSSPERFVVWLNDGHGHLERANRWSCAHFLMGDLTSGFKNNCNETDRASATETERSPFGRMVLSAVAADLNLEGSFSPRLPGSYSELLAFRLTARSPPPIPAC